MAATTHTETDHSSSPKPKLINTMKSIK